MLRSVVLLLLFGVAGCGADTGRAADARRTIDSSPFDDGASGDGLTGDGADDGGCKEPDECPTGYEVCCKIPGTPAMCLTIFDGCDGRTLCDENTDCPSANCCPQGYCGEPSC